MGMIAAYKLVVTRDVASIEADVEVVEEVFVVLLVTVVVIWYTMALRNSPPLRGRWHY